MRWIAIFALMMLTACSSGGRDADAASAVRAALNVLAAGLSSEDPILASEPIGQQFFLGSEVASRYTFEWDANEGTPAVGRFRTFFSDAFARFANVQQQFTVEDVETNGSLATVRVESRFDAIRIDSTPALNVTFSTTDYMLFELQAGGWRLIRWDEQPPTE